MEIVVYIVECADQTLYTGWTNNLERRLEAHNTGRGAKYTRSRCPVQVVYVEPQPDQATAQRREIEIKRLRRREKLKLIRNK
jgi:putative endonuclease